MDWPMGYDGTEIFPQWVEPSVHIYLWPLIGWGVGAAILLLLAVLITRLPVRRRFWCEQAGREVEAAFEEAGSPGDRRYIAVLSCTAFEPMTHVRCHRSCLETLSPRCARVEA